MKSKPFLVKTALCGGLVSSLMVSNFFITNNSKFNEPTVSAVDKDIANKLNFNKVFFDHFEKYKFYGASTSYDVTNHALKVTAYILNNDVNNGHYYLVCNYASKTTTYQFQLKTGLQAFNFLVPYTLTAHTDPFVKMSLAFCDYGEWVYKRGDYDHYGYKQNFIFDYTPYEKMLSTSFNLNAANPDFNITLPTSIFCNFNDNQIVNNSDRFNFTVEPFVMNKNFFQQPLNNFFLASANGENNFSSLQLDSLTCNSDIYRSIKSFNGSWEKTSYIDPSHHTLFHTFYILNHTAYDPWTNQVISGTKSSSGITMPLHGSADPLIFKFNFTYNNFIYLKNLSFNVKLAPFHDYASFLAKQAWLTFKNYHHGSISFDKSDPSFNLSFNDIAKYQKEFSKSDYFNLINKGFIWD